MLAAACGGNDGPEEFMRMLPADTSYILYSDVARIRDDEDLRHLRKAMESAWPFETYYVDFRDVDYVASSVEGSDSIFFLGGLGDLDGLRDELDELDYDDDEYRDVEIWVGGSSHWGAFAFLPGGNVLAADYEAVKDLLRRRDRGGASLYDDAGDLWSSLPSGVMRGIYNNCIRADYTGCDFLGWSIAKENSWDFKYLWTFEFESDRDAARALDDIEDDFELRDRDDLRISSDGRRVSGELIYDLDDIVEYARFYY